MSLFTLWAIFTLPSVMEGITALFCFVFIGSLLVGLARAIIAGGPNSEPDFSLFKKTLIKVSIPLFIVATTVSLYPSEKQMLYIAGAYGVTNIERIEELPNKSVEYLIEKMETELQKMEETNNE